MQARMMEAGAAKPRTLTIATHDPLPQKDDPLSNPVPDGTTGAGQRRYVPRLTSRNLVLEGRRTTMRLEPEMWQAVAFLARRAGMTVSGLCAVAGHVPGDGGLTSKVRAFVVAELMALAESRP